MNNQEKSFDHISGKILLEFEFEILKLIFDRSVDAHTIERIFFTSPINKIGIISSDFWYAIGLILSCLLLNM